MVWYSFRECRTSSANGWSDQLRRPWTAAYHLGGILDTHEQIATWVRGKRDSWQYIRSSTFLQGQGGSLFGSAEVSSHLWDLRRLHRTVSSGANREPIHVDFPKLGGSPVRCIVASPPASGYRCLLTMLPGNLLVEMYRQHGPRLLERNVRSFLQLKGKVNQSIRKTIIDEPQMFLASITAFRSRRPASS